MFSLAATLALYPDLRHAYMPDLEKQPSGLKNGPTLVDRLLKKRYNPASIDKD